MLKKQYTPPKLTEYGQVKTLTLSNNATGNYCDKYGRRTNYLAFSQTCTSSGS